MRQFAFDGRITRGYKRPGASAKCFSGESLDKPDKRVAWRRWDDKRMARSFFFKRHAAQAAVIADAIEVGEKIKGPRFRARERPKRRGPQARRIRATRRLAAFNLHEVEAHRLDIRPEVERFDFQYVLKVRHLALTRR